jgi:hypothetical protein
MLKRGIPNFIMNNPHYVLSSNVNNIVPYLSNFTKDIFYYNTIKDPVNKTIIYTFAYSLNYDDHPVLNHYRTKTCEEFIQKIIKGKGDMDSTRDFHPISLFFESNEYSKEKEECLLLTLPSYHIHHYRY